MYATIQKQNLSILKHRNIRRRRALFRETRASATANPKKQKSNIISCGPRFVGGFSSPAALSYAIVSRWHDSHYHTDRNPSEAFNPSRTMHLRSSLTRRRTQWCTPMSILNVPRTWRALARRIKCAYITRVSGALDPALCKRREYETPTVSIGSERTRLAFIEFIR